mgnify:CR=1 FL=1
MTLGFMTLTGVIILATMGLIYVTNKPDCDNFGRLIGAPTHYSLATSCLVKQGDKWVYRESLLWQASYSQQIIITAPTVTP